MSNKISKKDLLNYIKEQSQNLYKLHSLKEEKSRIESELNFLNENKYSAEASKFIGKEISHLEKDKDYKHDRAVAAAINIAKDKGYKVPKKKLNEAALSEKGKEVLQKWVNEMGARPAAVKLIDNVLIKRIGLSSSDLSDTSTFASGLDDIETLLEDGSFNEALDVAIDTAKQMIEEEGGDLFGESKEGNKKISRDELMDLLEKRFPKAWFKPGENFGGGYSERTIWTGEGSEANNGMPLFDAYSSSSKYVMDVYKPFNDLVESMGYYVEPYDSGTYFIIPK